MTFRNKQIEVGDLVQSVWTGGEDKQPWLTGVVVGFEDYNQRLNVIKAKVLWNEVGTRLEFLSDLKRIN